MSKARVPIFFSKFLFGVGPPNCLKGENTELVRETMSVYIVKIVSVIVTIFNVENLGSALPVSRARNS